MIAVSKVELLIRDMDQWPNWPILPMLRLSDGTDGIILGNEEHDNAVKGVGQFTIFQCNMFMMPDDLSTVPQSKYPTIEAMLREWRID